MWGGAVLLAEASVVPVIVVVVVAAMFYVTMRQISVSRRESGNNARKEPPPYSTSPPFTGHLDSGSTKGFLRPDIGDSTHDGVEGYGPVNMMRAEGEPPDDRAAQHRVAIKTYNFRTFDADTGPPDRDCFYDEIVLELYDEETAATWVASYFVATPAGLMRLMREEGWNAMFGNNHLIVPRYDVNAIVGAILRQLNNAWEETSQ